MQVNRKDQKEGLENLLRRFNKKVQQSGKLSAAKANQYFEKPISKTDRRVKAIRRNERRENKYKPQIGS